MKIDKFILQPHNFIILLLIKNSLPTQKIDKAFIQNLTKKTDQDIIKSCVICMCNFEENEIIKTLPCCKLLILLF